MSRFGKQAIYGFFYLLILALLGVWVYFAYLRPAPGCFNGRQDSGEEGADCGGVCAAACLPAGLSDLQVTETRVFQPGGGVTAVLAKLQNPNLETAAYAFDYEFKLYDINDNLILSRTGSSYVYGGEIKYVADFISGGAAEKAEEAEFVVSNPRWLPSADFSKPQLVILNRSAEKTAAGVQISGRLASRDTLLLPGVEVMAVFYGSYGYALGVSKTEIDNIAPNETRDFVISHPAVAGMDLSRTEYFISARRPL